MLLILGKSGQLARALADIVDLSEAHFAGRDTIDLSVPEAVADQIKALNPSCVINAAAFTVVDQAETDRKAAFAVNALSVREIGLACAHLQIPLVHVSTDYVFDSPSGAACREDDPTAPINYYGASKLAGEQYLLELKAQTAIVRTSWVYGTSPANFLTRIVGFAEAGQDISATDDQFSRPTNVTNLANACLFLMQLLKTDERAGGVYHFANKGVASRADMAEVILAAHRDITGKTTAMQRVSATNWPAPAKRPDWSVLDTGKIEACGLHIEPWQAGIKGCVEAILSSQNDLIHK